MKYTIETYTKKANEIHNNRYDYSKVDLEHRDEKGRICIICSKHGEFWIVPSAHLRGVGCKKCGTERTAEKLSKGKERFIDESKQIHGDKYDYSKVEYKGANKEVRIICPIHGEFMQKPVLHINQGCGCQKCSYELISKKNSIAQAVFMERAYKIHGNKYDYSKVDLEHRDEKGRICIICSKHGEFWMKPHSHVMGQGCRKCANEKLSKERLIDTDIWIERAHKIHGNRYDYSKTVYKGYDKKLIITCRKHGDFEQLAYDHLQGKGCHRCRKSKLEIEIGDFLEKNGIEFQDNVRPPYLSNGYSHLSLDFYLPQYNAAIECQGNQHFEEGTFFEKRKETIKERDKRKYDLCKNHVKLYYYSNFKIDSYFDKVYNDKEELLKAIIHNYEEKKLL